MTPWQLWIQRPQRLWLRRLFFQIHLWVGVAVGLYVAAVSVSGGLIVTRREFKGDIARPKVIVAGAGRVRMPAEVMTRNVQTAYPTCEVLSVTEPENLSWPYGVVLACREKRIERLFDPYTGADLGDPRSGLERAFQWLTDLHDNLLFGFTGRTLNGIGALLITVLALSGTVIWWPGIKNWRRSMTINPKARFARFNWDLHSAVGFWSFLLVLTWGISGICLCFPGILNSLIHSPLRFWIIQLHFGRFNVITEGIWTILGLAPAVLAATGALMWWNRVLSKKL